MRRIAPALAAMAITSLAQDEAVATLCEFMPSPTPTAKGDFVDRAHDVESGVRKASEAPNQPAREPIADRGETCS